ncbi:helix-turn-helix domain-containing protein [Anaerotignum sp. MB30-C6]|uniref:helix-turn-helix domain-containing protein n=1 Tax=Anaerotignum sp. MB30-C6 TaxID=3070814 RepID=UPI0027DB7C13|nr:helix-turn-helix transcriptional regulator [Anaerotignum sp. MB30-C6]WMI81896.1 helix-turn-helix transcriptional regulator [Anaerotignum sp. MB30-C6]
MYDRIKSLCKKHGISVNRLEQELDIAKGSLCKMNTSKPSVERAQKIADYFGVTVDYLMNGEEANQINKFALNDRDKKDIAKDMETIRAKLVNKEDGPASFDGENIDEAEVELVLDSIEMMLKRLKRINKEKYNPYKNKNKK